MADTAITQTQLNGLERLHQGKVRDVYAVDDEHLLFVATDRISAFDRVLGSGIPGKGVVLTQTSNFWFHTLADVVPNHLVAWKAADMPASVAAHARELAGRAVLVKRAEIVPVECIVRGYLAGSVAKKYERDGAIQGVTLPAGIPLGGQLPEPIFTPTTKAAEGHDMPLTYAELENELGAEQSAELRDLSLTVFKQASARCAERGLILCDTKFEFGRLPSGQLVLADEALTPDSSRFFKADQHVPGKQPVPWDKQLVRDYLKSQPGLVEGEAAPVLPDAIVSETASRYREVFEILSGKSLADTVAEAVA
jgi:phosphoribosylaminoimidazole-succinocarboxamide synthase